MAMNVPAPQRITVADLLELDRLGAFADTRVELLDGEIAKMTPIGPRHAGCMDRLTRLFVTQAGDLAVVRVQQSVVLDDFWAPQPDLALLRPPFDRYDAAHPRPDDILLVVEVAESSLVSDRDRKVPRYAAAGITECWIVDLETEQVLVCTEPSEASYRHREAARRDEILAPSALPAITVPVAAILVGR